MRPAEEARTTKESGKVEAAGDGADRVEWQDVVADLATSSEGMIEQDGKRFVVRSQARGVTSRVFRGLGMALPPVIRQEQAPTLVP